MEYLKYFSELRKKGFKPKLDVDIDIDAPKDLGIKIKATLSLEDLGANTAIDFIEGKLLKKTEVNEKISKLVLALIYSFGIDIGEKPAEDTKVTDIKTKREENENEKILKSELTEEDMNKWTEKSCVFYASDVSKLSNLKTKLRVKTNDELVPYIREFSDGEFVSVKDIVPKNIEEFNDYLENKLGPEDKEGGKAV